VAEAERPFSVVWVMPADPRRATGIWQHGMLPARLLPEDTSLSKVRPRKTPGFPKGLLRPDVVEALVRHTPDDCLITRRLEYAYRSSFAHRFFFQGVSPVCSTISDVQALQPSV
jgi:hypothetical protein